MSKATAEKLYKIHDGKLVEVEPPKEKDISSKKTYTTEEARAIIGIGRNKFMELLTTGRLKGIKVGSKWIIPAWAIDQFLEA